LPALGQGRRVEGVTSLRRLFVTDPDTPVQSIMAQPVAVYAQDDQEHAARVVRDHRLVAVSVVDAEQRLLGCSRWTTRCRSSCARVALGDVRFRDLPRVVCREVRTGILLGTLLAAVGLIPAVIVAGAEIATVVGLTLVTICTLATTVGAVVPIVARRLGLDPAVVSAPFIATFVDAAGLVVYFLIARAALGL
jgi:Mg/Co/Ni transporter MgtE